MRIIELLAEAVDATKRECKKKFIDGIYKDYSEIQTNGATDEYCHVFLGYKKQAVDISISYQVFIDKVIVEICYQENDTAEILKSETDNRLTDLRKGKIDNFIKKFFRTSL